MLMQFNSPGGSERLELLNQRADPTAGSDELVLKPTEGMSVSRLEAFLEEISQQPPWRRQADKEADYFDGNQLTAEQIQELEDRGFAPIITNLIQPTINVVLGMEAKTRSDWIVRAEDGEISEDLAAALSAKLHKAEVESRADRGCSDAYASQVKVGLGWVEVSRNSDPFDCRYRARSIHRREISWDWRSQEPDLSDARYLVRKRWLDEDTAVAAFPEQAEMIRHTLANWAHWDSVAAINESNTLELNRALDVQRGFSIEQYEWLNSVRRRIAAYEVWYRTVAKGHVLRLPNGRIVELDLNNEDHIAAVYTGQLNPIPAIFKKVRLAWWLGPNRVSDEPSPYQHNHFPYVPFFGFREDRTGTPYGLIRPMISPQDEINARRSKMLWLLNAKRVIADGDAVLDHDQAMEEVGRPDAYIKLNPSRQRDSIFKVEEGGQLAAQQFQVLEAAKQEINQTSGIYQSMLGQGSQATSGLAINSLIEQGSTTLAEINDNYRFARRLVGEMLLELVREDLAKEIDHRVLVGDEGDQREVILNARSTDELGRPTIDNDLRKIRASVVLDDVPTSPTFRHQQMTLLTELTKSLPPQIQPLIIDMVVEAMDLPKKRELLKRIRAAVGIGQNGQPPDPEKQQMAQTMQQLQAEFAALQEESARAIQQAEQKAAVLQIQNANKEGELALKSRELDIKEGDQAMRVDGQLVDQEYRAADHALSQSLNTQAAVTPEQVVQLVQQAMTPLVEKIALLIALEKKDQQEEQSEPAEA